MAEIDQNVLELVERRIAERVADNVERALKWRYGIVLVVFTAVATMFGWSIKSGIDAEIDTVVEESSDRIDDEIERLVGKAQESSRQAEISFGIASNVGQRVMSNMDVVEKRVVDFDAKLKILAELEGRVDGVGKKLDDLGAQSDARLAKLALNLDDVGRIRGIDANLSALAEQVAVLQTVVRNVAAAAKAEPVPGPSYAEARSAVEDIVAQSSQRNESFAKAAGEPVTVFFQFAGGQRQQAAALSKELSDAGFDVPGEERTAGAKGQHEVRYFHDGDAGSAQALVTAVNAALQQLGYDATAVTIKDSRNYAKLKPREGTLELWLELPPRQSAS